MDEPLFQVRARGFDRQEGRQWSEVFADELTPDDLARMGPAERREAEEWRAKIAEVERHPLDHEAALHNVEPSEETMAECGAAAE